MKILSAKQMARLDRFSIKRRGISAQKLMANAAFQCCEVLLAQLPKTKQHIVILCGPGNNGGDGFAMAGMLEGEGHQVSCFFYGR